MAILTIKDLVEMVWNNPDITTMTPTQQLGILNDNTGYFSNMMTAIGIQWTPFKELILLCETLEEAQTKIEQVIGKDKFLSYKENKTIQPADSNKPGVYFIYDTRAVKIGVANNIDTRIKQLQTGNPYELQLLKFIETQDPYTLEKRFHQLLDGKRMTGEWFDLTPEDVELFI